jgi:hypothetical protein
VFSGTGQFLIDILPEALKTDTDYFADNIMTRWRDFAAHREGIA